MTLTRRTLLKRASIAGLALAFGKLPEMSSAAEVVEVESLAAPLPRVLPGWLPLDGRTIKASEYPELHTALRGVYGPRGELTDEPQFHGGVMGQRWRRQNPEWRAQEAEALGEDVEFAIPDLRANALGAYMNDPIASPHMATSGPYAGQIHWKIRTEETA